MTDQPTLDRLMALDPLELSAQDIDDLVAHYRQQRANAEAGIKPKKETGPKATIDLSALGLVKKADTVRRRV